MEVSNLVSRKIPYLSGDGIGTRSSQPLVSGDVHFPGRNAFGARLMTRRAMNFGFDDNRHVEFYYSGSRFASNNKKEIKKKLKLLKGLAKGLAAQLQENLISERAEALLQQLELVRAEEELKKKKLMKPKIKAELMKTMNEGENNEIGEGVTDTNNGVGLD